MTQAELTAHHLATGIGDPEEARLGERVRETARLLNLRVTVMAPGGTVLADSLMEPSRTGNLANAPDVAAATQGETPTLMETTSPLGEELVAVAVPVHDEGRLVAVVRFSMPRKRFEGAIEPLPRIFLTILALLTGFLLLAALLLVQRLKRKWRTVAASLNEVATDTGSWQIPPIPLEPLAELPAVLDRQADRLKERMSAEARKQKELAALFVNLPEGLLVIDDQERVVEINPAAAAFLGVESELAQGKRALEVIRNINLQRLIRTALDGEGRGEAELTVRREGVDRHILARALPLPKRDTARRILVVLHDVTGLRRLKAMRRDFVANVSHELKTPLTSISGYAETLLDQPPPPPETARRFLEVIQAESRRLLSIIEDLLTLSRLEQHGDKQGAQIVLAPHKLLPVARSAIERCRPLADSRRITLNLTGDEDLEAVVNPGLLEQAVVNLVDNAVKYSPEGSTVTVILEQAQAKGPTIAVRDQGPGIPPGERERIFERFYRVDKARSKKAGGTGLGLAIVKHIVLVHQGEIWVEGTPGKGATFAIQLPSKPRTHQLQTQS